MGKEGPFPAVGSSPCLKSNFPGHLDKLRHLSGPWSSPLDSSPPSDPDISVGPRAAPPRAPSVSLGGTRARSWRTCFPSGNALDSVLALGGTPGCSNLAARPCSTSRTSEPQLARAIGRPCPPHLPGPYSGSCLMGSPPASSQASSPERRCIMATWPRAHGPQPSRGINPHFPPLSMPSSTLSTSHACQPLCSPFSSLNSPGWGQAEGLSTRHSFSLQGRPHTLQGGLPSSVSTQTLPLRSPLPEALLCPALPTPGPSLSSPEHL